ncbi:hypothetical protein ACCD07_16505, partial [Duganella sp. Dugasp56]
MMFQPYSYEGRALARLRLRRRYPAQAAQSGHDQRAVAGLRHGGQRQRGRGGGDGGVGWFWFSWSIHRVGWERPRLWDAGAGDYATADGW